MQTRIALAGFIAVAIVLDHISADRFYNLSHFHLTKAYFSASRGAFAGYVIAAASDFALLYMVRIASFHLLYTMRQPCALQHVRLLKAMAGILDVLWLTLRLVLLHQSQKLHEDAIDPHAGNFPSCVTDMQ